MSTAQTVVRRASAAVVAVALVVLAGCGGGRSRTLAVEELPFQALTATRQELLERLLEQSGAVDTIRSSVNYTPTSLRALDDSSDVVQTEYDTYRGALLVERPSLIFMNANAALGLVLAFEMFWDGDEFRLSVPARNRFYIGPNDAEIEGDNPLYGLRPYHVMQALFVDIRGYVDSPSIVRSFVERQDGRLLFYVFHFIDVSDGIGRTLETVWIDRRNLEVARKEVFDENGSLEMRVLYDSYRDLDGISFPFHVVIERPMEGATLDIAFDQPQLNVEIDDDVWALDLPRGFQEIRLVAPRPVAANPGSDSGRGRE